MRRLPLPTDMPNVKLRSAALTDIGRVRRQNEDRFLHEPDLAAFGVADGIGGLPGGALAAGAAVEGLRESLARHLPQRAEELVPQVLQINTEVGRLGEQISPGVGIGTTLTFGVIVGGRLLLAHVGDSRCYLLSGGRFEMLTEDHSVENEARHRRARGEQAEYAERYRQALTRCIGQPADPLVDVSEHPLAADDVLLFATDGVARVLSDAELASTIGAPGPLEERLAALIARANALGGPDNATAVLVTVDRLD